MSKRTRYQQGSVQRVIPTSASSLMNRRLSVNWSISRWSAAREKLSSSAKAFAALSNVVPGGSIAILRERTWDGYADPRQIGKC